MGGLDISRFENHSCRLVKRTPLSLYLNLSVFSFLPLFLSLHLSLQILNTKAKFSCVCSNITVDSWWFQSSHCPRAGLANFCLLIVLCSTTCKCNVYHYEQLCLLLCSMHGIQEKNITCNNQMRNIAFQFLNGLCESQSINWTVVPVIH